MTKPREQKRRAVWRAGRLRWQVLPAGALLIALGLILHLPARSPNAIMDDAAVFSENRAVSGGEAWLWAPFYADAHRPLWRPLATLSLRADWRAQPGDHARARTVSVVCLVLLALLSYGVLRRLGLGALTSCLLAAVLLVHPATTESWQRLAGRSELLAACLMMLVLLLYLNWRRASSPAALLRWTVLGALFLLALLAKEAALLVPLLIAGFEIGALGRARGPGATRRQWAPLVVALIIAASWGAFRAGVLRGWPHEITKNPGPDIVAALETKERATFGLTLPAHYGGLALCTGELLPDYSHLLARPADAPAIEIGNPRSFGLPQIPAGRVMAGVAILLAGFALWFWGRRRWPVAAWGGWWTSTALLIMLPLLATNGQVASARNLLFILPGLLLLLGPPLQWGLAALAGAGRRWHPRQLLLVLPVLAVLGALGARTASEATAWQSQSLIMHRLDRLAPRSPETALYFGLSAAAQGDFARATEHLEESVVRFPRNARALMNLGLLWAQTGRSSLAMRALADAAFIASYAMPGSSVESQTHMVLGVILGEQGLDEEALVEFQKAIAADSTNIDALARGGVLEAMQYSTARQGIRHIERALELDRGRGQLGELGQRIREVKARAEGYLGITGADQDSYEHAMDPETGSPDAGGAAQRE